MDRSEEVALTTDATMMPLMMCGRTLIPASWIAMTNLSRLGEVRPPRDEERGVRRCRGVSFAAGDEAGIVGGDDQADAEDAKDVEQLSGRGQTLDRCDGG